MVERRTSLNIPEIGTLHKSTGSFDKCLSEFNLDNIQLLSFNDYARISAKINSRDLLFKYDGFDHTVVREGAIILPGECTVLVRESPLLELASEIVNEINLRKVKKYEAQVKNHNQEITYDDYLVLEHSYRLGAFKLNNNIDYLQLAEAEKSLSPAERRFLIISRNSPLSFEVPTNRFGENELTLWAFRDMAKNQGEMLKELGRKKFYFGIPLPSNDKKTGDKYAKQMYYSPYEGEFCGANNYRLLDGTFLGLKTNI